jgi:hypothetical protein
MKTLTAEEILALRPGMLIQSTTPAMPVQGEEGIPWSYAWLITGTPIDGRLYEVLEPMWHNPLDYNFETASDMAEAEKPIRIA